MQAIYLQQLEEREYDPETKRNPFTYSYLVTRTINRMVPKIGKVLNEDEVTSLVNSTDRYPLSVVIEESPRSLQAVLATKKDPDSSWGHYGQ